MAPAPRCCCLITVVRLQTLDFSDLTDADLASFRKADFVNPRIQPSGASVAARRDNSLAEPLLLHSGVSPTRQLPSVNGLDAPLGVAPPPGAVGMELDSVSLFGSEYAAVVYWFVSCTPHSVLCMAFAYELLELGQLGSNPTHDHL